MALIHQMPSIRHNYHEHCHFLPHFPSGPMRCEFSPELVPLLPHAMMGVFPKLESEATYRVPTSPLTLTEIPQQLIHTQDSRGSQSCQMWRLHIERSPWGTDSTSGDLGFMPRSGYLLLVYICPSFSSPFRRKRFAQWPTNIWTCQFPFPVKLHLKFHPWPRYRMSSAHCASHAIRLLRDKPIPIVGDNNYPHYRDLCGLCLLPFEVTFQKITITNISAPLLESSISVCTSRSVRRKSTKLSWKFWPFRLIGPCWTTWWAFPIESQRRYFQHSNSTKHICEHWLTPYRSVEAPAISTSLLVSNSESL